MFFSRAPRSNALFLPLGGVAVGAAVDVPLRVAEEENGVQLGLRHGDAPGVLAPDDVHQLLGGLEAAHGGGNRGPEGPGPGGAAGKNRPLERKNGRGPPDAVLRGDKHPVPGVFAAAHDEVHRHGLFTVPALPQDDAPPGMEGRPFAGALKSRAFEPDAPNYTPRISGLLSDDAPPGIGISFQQVQEISLFHIRPPYLEFQFIESSFLIIYHPVRKVGKELIVTNGDQTDTVRDYLLEGRTFAEALKQRTFEPDGPHLILRIQRLPPLLRQGLRRLRVQDDPLRVPLEGGQGIPVPQVGVEEAALPGKGRVVVVEVPAAAILVPLGTFQNGELEAAAFDPRPAGSPSPLLRLSGGGRREPTGKSPEYDTPGIFIPVSGIPANP